MKKLSVLLFVLLLLLAPGVSFGTVFDISQLTNNTEHDGNPSVYNGTIAWWGYDGHDREIFYWDGNQTVQVTNNASPDHSLSLYNGTIAWSRWEDGGRQVTLYYWDGNTTTNISSSVEDSHNYPSSLYNATIAWSGLNPQTDPPTSSIYYWDGNNTSMITSTTEGYVEGPSLYDGTIAWSGYNGGDREIFFWDGNNISMITDNDTDDWKASLYDGTIAWQAFDGNDYEIFYWDGENIIQVTDNDLVDEDPSLYDGAISWTQDDGNDQEVLYWDGETISQVTDNATHDFYPSLYGDTIAWYGVDVVDNEIYYATITSAPGPSTVQIDIRPFSWRNRINRWGWGFIPVAILSDGDFDATSKVDTASLTFGQTGDEESLWFCLRRGWDVDRNGYRDLICLFWNKKTGFQCGDTEGNLQGQTKDGKPIEGSDSVRIVPCR